MKLICDCGNKHEFKKIGGKDEYGRSEMFKIPR